jgi:hypothetical protein
MVAKSADAAARSIHAIADELRDADAIRDAFGEQLASDARAAGGRTSRPRQAHLVAGSIRYQDGSIGSVDSAPAGHGTVGELLWGAVFGSSIYRQFGPHASSGYWLFPQLARPSPAAIDAGEQSIDELIRDAI